MDATFILIIEERTYINAIHNSDPIEPQTCRLNYVLKNY